MGIGSCCIDGRGKIKTGFGTKVSESENGWEERLTKIRESEGRTEGTMFGDRWSLGKGWIEEDICKRRIRRYRCQTK